MTIKNKLKTIKEESEYGIDSRYKSNKDKATDSIALMQARLERMKYVSKEQILRAKLLQLKLKMEDYLKEPVYDDQNHFAKFLETYIDIIYSKRTDFAKDIKVTANFLSKVVNRHREPKAEFILKLMVHSEKVFKQVGNFNKETWYLVYYHDKLCETMSNQDQWRPRISKQVKFSNMIVR